MIGAIRTQGWVVRVLFAGLTGLSACTGYALSDTDFQGAMNYDFRPPGARSLAMGGAFTALADDATSVLLNPAGLVQLRRPEFSLVGKVWTEDMHLDWGGGTYTNLAVYQPAFPTQTTTLGLGYGWQSVVASPCDHADFAKAINSNKRQPRRLGQRTT